MMTPELRELLSAMAALMADARLMIDDEGYRQILSDSIDRAEKAYAAFPSEDNSMQQGDAELVKAIQYLANIPPTTDFETLISFDDLSLDDQLIFLAQAWIKENCED